MAKSPTASCLLIDRIDLRLVDALGDALDLRQDEMICPFPDALSVVAIGNGSFVEVADTPRRSVADAKYVGQYWFESLCRKLAGVRYWRAAGTIGPPADMVRTTLPTIGFAESARLTLQEMIDRVWVDITKDRTIANGVHWRSGDDIPDQITHRGCQEHRVKVQDIAVPLGAWCHGWHSWSAMILHTHSAVNGAAVVRHHLGGDVVEVRLSGTLPATIQAALIGRDVSTVLEHQSLSWCGHRITDIQIRNKSTVLKCIREDPFHYAGGSFLLDGDHDLVREIQHRRPHALPIMKTIIESIEV